MNILILGCGKLGQALAIDLHHQGHQITCISTSPKQLPSGINHLCQDIHTLDLKQCPIFEQVYVILAPQQRTILGYQSTYLDTIKPIYLALAHQLEYLKQIVYISSTRIYDYHDGQVIDDDTAIKPYESNDALAKVLISAEILYQAYFGEKAIIIRPSGLYDESSLRLQKLAQDLIQIDEFHYMNLIHRKDVVAFLSYLLNLTNPMPSYILNSKTVIRGVFLNRLRQQQNLPLIDMADNLPKTGKRLNAKRMNQSGFVPKYDII